jgi:[ribosomal protein S18]-alanine N-acetyltransferase
MDLTKTRNRLAECLMILNRILRDTAGVFLSRQWKQTKKENIVTVEDSMLPEIFRIQAQGFKNKNREKIVRYSNSFRKTFYVIKEHDKIAGYCIYYLKPSLSSRGFEKQSVISEIAIDRNFRGRGFAEKLLKESIEEMKMNRVSSILLYVNIKNQPAINLYKKFSFIKTKEVKNICGPAETCYEMGLRLI